MPRRPNYSFERNQRSRAKAAKREAKREARAARKAGDPQAEPPTPEPDGPRPTVVPGALAAPDEDRASTDGR